MVIAGTVAATSVAANSKSADLAANFGTYQYLGKGMLVCYGRSSATGMNLSVSLNGTPIINDSPFPWFGTAGQMTKKDHEIFTQKINGGRLEVYMRNTTGGALTGDLMFEFVGGA